MNECMPAQIVSVCVREIWAVASFYNQQPGFNEIIHDFCFAFLF